MSKKEKTDEHPVYQITSKIKSFANNDIKKSLYLASLIFLSKKLISSTKIFLRNKINNFLSIKKFFFKKIRKIEFNKELTVFISVLVFDFIVVLKVVELTLNIRIEEIVPYQTVFVLYQIIGTTFISLFIFIAAEGMRDTNEKYKLKILLQESSLATIIILFLLWIIFLPFFKESTIPFLVLVGFIFLGIYAVYQIISVILNSETLWMKRVCLFKNRIQEVTKFLINIRLKNKELLDRIRNKQRQSIKLGYGYPLRISKDIINLKSVKNGTVTDIDLDRLESMLDEMNKISKEISADSEYAETQHNLNVTYVQANSNRRIRESQRSEKQINLRIKIGDEIEIGTPLLFYDRKIEIDQNNLQRQLNDLITIEDSTVIDEVRTELEDFKIMMKKFIDEKNDFQFEKQFSLYLDLAKYFLNEISKHGQYSYQEAKEERNIMPIGKYEGWPPLIWLREHIMYLFKEIKYIKSHKIHSKIKWFPFHIIALSQEKNDHLLFQETLFLWKWQLSSFEKSDRKFIKNHITFFKKEIMELILKNIEEEKQGNIRKEKEGLRYLFIRSYKRYT